MSVRICGCGEVPEVKTIFKIKLRQICLFQHVDIRNDVTKAVAGKTGIFTRGKPWQQSLFSLLPCKWSFLKMPVPPIHFTESQPWRIDFLNILWKWEVRAVHSSCTRRCNVTSERIMHSSLVRTGCFFLECHLLLREPVTTAVIHTWHLAPTVLKTGKVSLSRQTN